MIGIPRGDFCGTSEQMWLTLVLCYPWATVLIID